MCCTAHLQMRTGMEATRRGKKRAPGNRKGGPLTRSNPSNEKVAAPRARKIAPCTGKRGPLTGSSPSKAKVAAVRAAAREAPPVIGVQRSSGQTRGAAPQIVPDPPAAGAQSGARTPQGGPGQITQGRQVRGRQEERGRAGHAPGGGRGGGQLPEMVAGPGVEREGATVVLPREKARETAPSGDKALAAGPPDREPGAPGHQQQEELKAKTPEETGKSSKTWSPRW